MNGRRTSVLGRGLGAGFHITEGLHSHQGAAGKRKVLVGCLSLMVDRAFVPTPAQDLQGLGLSYHSGSV